MRIILLFLLITNCSYHPVIDTKGRTGTFDNSRAEELTDDIQHCKTLAKENSNSVENALSVFFTNQSRYKTIYKNCLTGRNHSVVL